MPIVAKTPNFFLSCARCARAMPALCTHAPKIAKTADIAKMAEKYINGISARPTPPHTNPVGSRPKNTFSTQNQKKMQKSHDFQHNKGGIIFFDIFAPPPPPLMTPQKSGFQVGGGSRGSDQKLTGGCIYWTK